MDIGKSRSYDIIEYRNEIKNAMFGDPDFLELFKDKCEYPEDLFYKNVNPHEFIPETVTETDRYVNYDMRADIDPRNNTFKDMKIWFFISCHIDSIRTTNGLWFDKMGCAIDNIFGDKNTIGVGKTSVISNVPYRPHSKLVGRILTLTVKEFSDGKKNGK